MKMIHDPNDTLEAPDREALERQAQSEEERILQLMGCRRSECFAAFEMAALLDIREGNARRALSNMSGSLRRHADQYGNFPVLKRIDVKRRDPSSGVRVCTYQYNPKFGLSPAPDQQGQAEMFPERFTRRWS